MNAIQYYTTTNDGSNDNKDQFYEWPQSIIAKCPKNDFTILRGDINSKAGMDNTGYQYIMRRHGLKERNESGERFANLYAFNKFVISGTIFPHR